MAQHVYGLINSFPGTFSRRWLERVGVMVRAGITWRGKTQLVVVDGNLNSENYVHLLESVLLPFETDKYPNGYIFQQDNAPAHTAQHTQDFFTSECIDVLPWPARSADLNVIENCWGEMTRRLYARGRQFDTIADLKEALFY